MTDIQELKEGIEIESRKFDKYGDEVVYLTKKEDPKSLPKQIASIKWTFPLDPTEHASILEDAISRILPGTMKQAYEITNERRTHPRIKNRLKREEFFTSDFLLYRIEGNEEILYVAPKEENLILQNLDEAIEQTEKWGFYSPSETGLVSLLKSTEEGKTLRLRLQDLDLTQLKHTRYFKVNTESYSSLNPSQRALAEKIFGQETDFENNMRMLKEEGVEDARIQLLNFAMINTKQTYSSLTPEQRSFFENTYCKNVYFDKAINSLRDKGVEGVWIIPAHHREFMNGLGSSGIGILPRLGKIARWSHVFNGYETQLRERSQYLPSIRAETLPEMYGMKFDATVEIAVSNGYMD